MQKVRSNGNRTPSKRRTAGSRRFNGAVILPKSLESSETKLSPNGRGRGRRRSDPTDTVTGG